MTSGQDVSEYLDTLGLLKSYFSSFLRGFGIIRQHTAAFVSIR
jgi:hypothetical protein